MGRRILKVAVYLEETATLRYYESLKCIIIFQVYINNKTQIDPVLDKVKAQLSEISGKVTAMIPQAKPAEKTE